MSKEQTIRPGWPGRSWRSIALALAILLSGVAGTASVTMAAGDGEGGGGHGEEADAAPGGDTYALDPLYAPMSPPEQGGRPQAAIYIELVLGPEGNAQKIRALLPRFRDALIRDFFGYPITQTGDFPDDMLPSVTKRVMNIATQVYGAKIVTGVLFTQILKIGC